jgi:iron complex outermembrane receptor protein
LFCLATVLVASGAAAPGQSAADQDLMGMKIEDLSRVQVYSASRHLEDIRKAPASVSIITADDIRRNGWRTLGEAIRSLRGFYTSCDRQYTYLGVRGFMRPGDYNSRILLLLNGHRLNDDVYDSAGFGSEFPLDLDLIDHIEVVRGPGSSLFGTNAVFGVINVITRQPAAETGAEVSSETGSFLDRTVRLTMAGRKGRASGLVSGTLTRSPGESPVYFPAIASPETHDGYAENMDGSHLENAFADVRDGDFRLQGLIASRHKVYPTGSFGTIFNDRRDWDEDAGGYLDASLERKVTATTEVDWHAYYDIYAFSGSGAFAFPGGSEQIFAKARASWMGSEITIAQEIGSQELTVGADYEYSFDIRQRTYIAGQPDAFRSDQSPWIAGVFADLDLTLTPELLLHAGARFDRFNSFVHAVSPRASLVWMPNDRTTMKYMVGQAFRSPNAYEEYYADGITVTTAPRPLVPERILSNELVVEHGLRPWLSMTADGYYNRLKQLIDQVPAGTSLLTYFVNDDRVHAEGLEFELTAERKSGLAARASYSASNGEDDAAGAPLENMPHSQAKFNGTAPLGRWGFGSLESVYIGAMTDGKGTRVPAYLLPNATFSSRPLHGWQLASSCYDFSNRRWFSPAGPDDPEDQIPMEGRAWRVSLSWRLAARGGGSEP